MVKYNARTALCISKFKTLKVYLAGQNGHPWIKSNFFSFYRLESYHNIAKKELEHINKYKSFILDSGAFSYMNGTNSKNVDWDNYIEQYASFINKHSIKLFMELDIDSIVGIKEVEKLRKKLEKLTNKQVIPVWHKSRGKEYWLKLINEYNYVAIGGIVTREIQPKEYKYFNWFIETARKENCRVHALGFTNLKGLTNYPFYSVDSTSWLSGNRFGSVYQFDGKTLQKQSKKEGQKVIGKDVAIHNFNQWVKFQKYADLKL